MSITSCLRCGLMAAAVLGLARCGLAQPERAAPGTKRALIFCGHPGDKEHAQLYSTVVRDLKSRLVEKLAFSEPEVRLQFGGTWPEDPAKPETKAPQHGPGTRESLEQEAAELRKALQAGDTLWVIVIGHAHHDGRKTWLNLPGPDISQDEFGKLFAGLDCREQVFFQTTSVSGFFLKPLALKERVVIAATEPDFETNETTYATALAEELAKLGPMFPDEDKDGVISLFDLHVGVARNVAQRYLDGMTLATEHSQMDDTGDGRGREVQMDYLTVEQGGRNEGKPLPPRAPEADGNRAAAIVLLPAAGSATGVEQ